MKNESGSTLIEAVLTVLIVTIATYMIASTFLTALAVNKDVQGEYDRVSYIYDNIELGDDATDTSWEASKNGRITYTYNGDSFTIEGKYTYDDAQEKIGEFIRN